MAMRPIGRDEALQHLFVLAIALFLVIAPIYLVSPPYAEYSLIGLGALFAVIDMAVMAALRRPRA
jgi:hypothetical protein